MLVCVLSENTDKAQVWKGNDGCESGSQQRPFLGLKLIVSWLLAVALQSQSSELALDYYSRGRWLVASDWNNYA